MRPKETAAARWLLHLVRVVAGTGGLSDAIEDANSLPAATRARPAARPCAAPLLHRGLAEALMADRPNRLVSAARIVGGGLGRGVLTPAARAGGR